MADINLTDDGSDVTIDVDIQTPQDFFYTIMVVDSTLKQFVHVTGKSGGPTSFPIGKTSDLVGKYLNIYWTVIDRNGAGNKFFASASAVQNGAPDVASQICSGVSTTSAANVGTAAQFLAVP